VDTFKCDICGIASPEEKWNEHTYEYCRKDANDPDSLTWDTDEHFYSLAREYTEDGGAWFYCPNCDHMHDTMADIYRVRTNFKNNKQAAKILLEESW
jgi:predicted RNA-binding Zn-ribbon protein involved in translation (DUF1610 family)